MQSTRKTIRQTILAAIAALAVVGAVTPAVAGEDYIIFGRPLLGG
jgi:hypothetical protein